LDIWGGFMGKGYMGKLLIVDLSKNEFFEEEIPDKVYEEYLSGTGLGAYYLYHKIPVNADPLGPDNYIGFMSGLLTGTGSLFTGRWMVVGKSPLTGTWGDANCGGNFSPAIKQCGYDGILFRGISEKPVYLYIDAKTMELRDASDVWGTDAVEAEQMLIKRYSDKGKTPRVACIGQAGENCSLISGVCNDRGRIAARSGLGAVMGSKKLKALVLNGNKQIVPHNYDEMKRLSKVCNRWVSFQPPFVTGPATAYVGKLMRFLPQQLIMDGMLYKLMLRKWGTVSMNQLSVEIGDSPIKNWDGSSADWPVSKSKIVNPDVFTSCEVVKYHCYSCPLGCGGICTMSGKYEETHKPEYETVICLGALCMNEDPDSIFYMNEMLNRAGMDTISAGHVLSFAIECYENGIITKEDTDGVELTWGNTDAMIEMLQMMIDRKGIGDILADGVRVASQKIGRGSEKFAIHAGGQEPAAHDGRGDPGFAIHYSVEPTPGRHTIGAFLYYEMFQLWKKIKTLPVPKILYNKDTKYTVDDEKTHMAASCSKYMNIINGVGACMFGAFLGSTRTPLFDWLNAATGWNKSPEEIMEIGQRIQTIKQEFNVKHGIEPKNIKMPLRTIGQPLQTKGANKGRSVNLDRLMSEYWQYFGWDSETGKPTMETKQKLGIN